MIDVRRAMKNRVTAVTKILKDQGYVIDDQWYTFVTLWLIWYMGFDPEFHIVKEAKDTNGNVNEIQISSLHMGKTVCEDWAALLLGEKTEITIEDETSNAYLQGEDDDQMQGGLFGETNFWQRANELVEKSFALGLGAIVPRVKEAEVSKDGTGRLLRGTASIDFFTADQIFPITYENRTITSCAFVSERAEKDKTVITVQIHEPGRVKFRYYTATKDGLEMVDMGDDYAQEIAFADKKLFLPSFIYPQINNHLDITIPFGVSVFSTAIDIIKGADLAYDNFNTDIELGRKMVFVSDELMDTDDAGRKVAPQKTRKRLFEKIGGDLPPSGDRDPFIHEYNPELRVDSNTKAVQAQLDYLSFKCGLGAKYYRFQDGTVQTATQIISENSVLFRNRQKHNTVIEKALIDFCRKALKLAVELKVKGIKPDTAITVVADDSIITDTNTEKMQFMQEITAGIRQAWEYRVKFFGEDEKKAKEMAKWQAPVASGFNLDDGEGGAAAQQAAAAAAAAVAAQKGKKGQEPGQGEEDGQEPGKAATEGAEE